MWIISVRDNENNSWKRDVKKKTKKSNKQRQRRKRGTEPIVKSES